MLDDIARNPRAAFEKLDALRELACITQAALCNRAGISISAYSKLRMRINKAPYPRTVRKLRAALEQMTATRTEAAE